MGAASALRAAAACAGLAATLAHAAAFDVAQLMRLLHDAHPGRARFNETQNLAMLDRPLESSGELVFRAPDHLEKRTTSPGHEVLVADGDRVTLDRDGQRQSLSLADYPQVAALVDSIRGTLSGDRAALERAFTLAVSGSAGAWRLALAPRGAAVAKLVKGITIEGAQGRVQRVEIEQADGDRSLMQIRPETP